MLDIDIFSTNGKHILTSEIISVALSTSVVNNESLGEDKVGVTILTIHTLRECPQLLEGDVHVITWRI